jgi:hypothetical protein
VQRQIKRFALLAVVIVTVAAVAFRLLLRATTHVHRTASDPSTVTAAPQATAAFGDSRAAVRPERLERREARASVSPQQLIRNAVAYDARTLDRMAHDWEHEAEDADRTVNVRTFIGALIDTVDDGALPATWPASLTVRCHTSVCRLDFGAQDMPTLSKIREESRQIHVQVRPHDADVDGGIWFEAYLGNEPEAPTESP